MGQGDGGSLITNVCIDAFVKQVWVVFAFIDFLLDGVAVLFLVFNGRRQLCELAANGFGTRSEVAGAEDLLKRIDSLI